MFSLSAECVQDAVFCTIPWTRCDCVSAEPRSEYVLQFYRLKCFQRQQKCSTAFVLSGHFYRHMVYGRLTKVQMCSFTMCATTKLHNRRLILMSLHFIFCIRACDNFKCWILHLVGSDMCITSIWQFFLFTKIMYYFYRNRVAAVQILCLFVQCVLHNSVKRSVHLRHCVARVSHINASWISFWAKREPDMYHSKCWINKLIELFPF